MTPPRVAKPKRTPQERIAVIEAKSATSLADANDAAERGAKRTAERLYERSQRYLDRANKLRGWT